eukprot:10132227-Lingulodinium_polyedra.AAC.1
MRTPSGATSLGGRWTRRTSIGRTTARGTTARRSPLGTQRMTPFRRCATLRIRSWTSSRRWWPRCRKPLARPPSATA